MSYNFSEPKQYSQATGTQQDLILVYLNLDNPIRRVHIKVLFYFTWTLIAFIRQVHYKVLFYFTWTWIASRGQVHKN